MKKRLLLTILVIVCAPCFSSENIKFVQWIVPGKIRLVWDVSTGETYKQERDCKGGWKKYEE